MANDQDSDPDWFWGEISRSQANELLQGAPDGSFLVRNSSSNPNDLTLTVKKDGVNKMMRIVCRNQRYGFREPLHFRSLRSLIELHQRQPLLEYNQEMDVCLQHPISKQAVLGELPPAAADAAAALSAVGQSATAGANGSGEPHVEKLMCLLVKANQDYLLVTQEYDRLFDGYNKSLNDVQMYKQALESFNEVIAILEEQLRLNEQLQREAMVHEVTLMTKHQQALQAKLRQVHEDRCKLDAELRKILLSSRSLDRQINELKPQIHEHKRSREQLSALLIRQGVRRELIERRLELMGDDEPTEEEQLAAHLDGPLSHGDLLGQMPNETLNYSCLDTEFLTRAAQERRRDQDGSPECDAPDDSCSESSQPIVSPPAEREDVYPVLTSRSREIRDVFEVRRGSEGKEARRNSESLHPRRNTGGLETRRDRRAEFDFKRGQGVDKENEAQPTEAEDRLDEPLESQLQRMEWYVGEMNREQINELLAGAPEGTFLLRDSSQRADAPYTLTVRKDGGNKMLRVLQRQGRFAFKEPFEFDSPLRLIRHHMRQPLLVNKSDLVIQLLHPWSSELHLSYRDENPK